MDHLNLFYGLSDAALLTGSDFIIEKANRAAERLFSSEKNRLEGTSLKELFSNEFSDDLMFLCTEGLGGRTIKERDMMCRKISGEQFPSRITIVPENRSLFIIIRDITEIKNLEKRLIHISQQERREIGRILHDDIGQNLSGMNYLFGALEEKLRQKMQITGNDIEVIADLMKKAMTTTRSLARGLSPIEAKDNLEYALEEFILETEKLFGVKIEFVREAPLFTETTPEALHIFYIAKEALHNAVKHGDGKHISLKIGAGDRGLLIKNTIDKNKETDGQEGIGIQIMRHRAHLIKMKIEIMINETHFSLALKSN